MFKIKDKIQIDGDIRVRSLLGLELHDDGQVYCWVDGVGEPIDHGIPKTEFIMGDEVVVLKHVDKDLVGSHKRISAVYYTSRGTRYYVQGSSWGCDKNDFERIQSAYTLF